MAWGGGWGGGKANGQGGRKTLDTNFGGGGVHESLQMIKGGGGWVTKILT